MLTLLQSVTASIPDATLAPPASPKGAVRGVDPSDPRTAVDLLLLRVADGDVQAFDALYTLTSRRVYGLVRRTLSDAELSAEITQDGFLGLWHGAAARFDSELGSGMSWILTLAHRRAVDRVRSEESHRKRNLRWCTKNQDVDYDTVADVAIRESEATAVHASLDALSAVQREAIHLAYFAGLTYVQVAERLGIPIPTAKTRIRDGIRRLRKALAEEA